MKLKSLQGNPCKSSKPELEQILGKIPTRKFRKLIHVGTPGICQSSSLEGPLLSTSEYPHEWRRIARIGGEPWVVQRNDGKPINLIHMLGRGTKKKLSQWGIETGLIEHQTWWRTPTSLNDGDTVLYSWCETKKEALAEYDPETGKKPEARKITVPSKPLWDFWNQRIHHTKPRTPWHGIDAAAAALAHRAEGILGQNHPLTPDGLFWNELLNPSILSAPRMGINPHAGMRCTPVGHFIG